MEQEISGLKVCRQLLLLQTLIQIRPQVVIFTGLLQRCKQWGNLWAGYTEVLNWYFPLTTSQVYAVCLTKHTKNISSGHNWEPARIEEWNNSYARIHPDGDLGYSVIAICKAQQQWGYQTVHGTNPVTYDLPIPFEEAPFTVAISTGNSGNHASCGGFTKTTIVLRAGTTAGVWDTVGFFIIGCQLQWGTNTIGSRTTRTEAYPLPYSEFCLPIVSGKGYVGGLNYGFGVGVTNFGLTSVTIANNSEDSSYRWTGYTYIVVGAQPQWGTSVSPIIFSISFSNTMYTILQMPQSASTSAFRAEVWALERKDQDSCAFFTGSGNYSRHWIAVGF